MKTKLLTAILSLLITSSTFASYPMTVRFLTWDESTYLRYGSLKMCSGDDKGEQFVKACTEVQEKYPDAWISQVALSPLWEGFFCPCHKYFVEDVIKYNQGSIENYGGH